MYKATALLLVAFTTSCGADHPTGASLALQDGPLASSSGCRTVTGVITQSGRAPLFTGTISGDIEGTVTTRLDPSQSHVAGVVSFSAGEQTWVTTGGTVDELIGRTVQLSFESEIVFAQVPAGRNNTRARIVDGASSGQLTYHGTLLVVPPPPFHARVDYHGVICP